MGNFLIQNQRGEFPSNPNKEGNFFKILLVCLGIVILVLIGEGIYFLKLLKKERTLSVPQTSEQASEGLLPNSSGVTILEAPVKKENLAKAKIVQLDYGVNDWAVFLPEGEGVYAGFSGLVEWAGEGSLQKVIMLRSEDGKTTWKYLFVGEPLIQNGQHVEKGQMIAKLGSEPLPTYDVNLVVQAFKEGKRVNLEF